jgi:hypothetical protein
MVLLQRTAGSERATPVARGYSFSFAVTTILEKRLRKRFSYALVYAVPPFLASIVLMKCCPQDPASPWS